MNMERYCLTLSHNYIDEGGKSHRVEEPIVCEISIYDPTMFCNPHCKNEIIDKLFYQMKHYIIEDTEI